ncbi:M23 family metallopeptidase [Pseudomonas sp. CC6-YY-74]|uniref:M23 family metallopeptidase n=1 Tax=Pseudomonas sp. CC6-YY-74 TaxID=1930532 RepID=UPI002114429D|nr:M23 family metallopeptidase [Pseudomonas sp. CC6-YY-74]
MPAEPLQVHPGALLVPVTGIVTAQLSDTFDDKRGTERIHEALDIMAPLKTPVVAVDDGKVVKLFDSVPGGLTVYQYDASGTFAYYYAHLDSYAASLVEGQELKRGDLLGYVGATGNANPLAPHLHFAIFLLGSEKQWWKGTAINPYPLFQR